MLTISKHRSVMLEVLKAIYGDTFLGPVLGLKGGTLLYILYNLPRFSVDLDFDLLDESKKDLILEKLGKILKVFGKVEELTDKKYTYFSLINYEKGQQSLKIEISKRSFGSSYEVNNYLGIAIRTMVKDDIFANKLIALVERKKPVNRDIFDTWYMLKNHWDINWELVEKRTKIKRDKYIAKCIKLLENWPLPTVLEGMGELLDNKTKAWVKEKLLEETIFLISVRLQGK